MNSKSPDGCVLHAELNIGRVKQFTFWRLLLLTVPLNSPSLSIKTSALKHTLVVNIAGHT